MRNPVDFIERRRNLIRSLYYQGYKEVDIIQKLDDAQFFPETQKWGLKRDTVRRDLDLITIADAKRFQGMEVDTNRAYHEYLSRQETIYRRALERNDLEAAIRTSKDIAKAHGVQTDEVNKPTEDLQTIMMRMKQKKLPTPNATLPDFSEEIVSFVPVNGKTH